MPTPTEEYPFANPPQTLPLPPDNVPPTESAVQMPAAPDIPPLGPGVQVPSDGWLDDPSDLAPGTIYGEVVGEHRAVLVVSDFHLSDGGIGDDFLENHLIRSAAVNPPGGGYVGNRAANPSRAILFSRVVAFAIARAQSLGIPKIDIVLNGDIFDLLEMLSRGAPWSKRHLPLFEVCDWANSNGHRVYYLCGNHDWIVPPGPWTAARWYVHQAMRVLVEHGDRFDRFNWPKGVSSMGAQLVLGTNIFAYSIGRLEIRADMAGLGLVYRMAGIDNVRPFDDKTITEFIRRHYAPGMFPNIATADAAKVLFINLLQAAGFVGHADDSFCLKGARWMQAGGNYAGWLMVHGHTHIPVAVPNIYYNTGTFTATIVLPGNETLIEQLPFLFLYHDGTGARKEEFYTVAPTGKGLLRNRGAVNRLRETVYGYPPF
jgi:UDP-2,3-diacylglucosamine pyrophosphatase LpxH